MEKKNIVKQLLKEGVLVSPGDLGKINERNLSSFLNNDQGKASGKEKASVDEYISETREGIRHLQKELERKIDPVSINKAGMLRGNVNIAGMIKEVNPGRFVLQDTTGEITVVSDAKSIDVGNVVGISGFVKDGSFFGESIHWPDIPLTGNQPVGSGMELVFANGADVPANGRQVVIRLPSGAGRIPKAVDMKTTKGKIKILLSGKETSEEEAILSLKRRQLKIAGIFDYMIKEAPDFLWFFNNKENWSRNYKGVAVISTKKGTTAVFREQKTIFLGNG